VTLLNVFFYLMMIVSGAAVALILHDLKRAEDRAAAAISRLQTDHGHIIMGQNSHKNIGSQRLAQIGTMRQISAIDMAGSRMTGFLTVADGSGQTERDFACQVQFDFSTVRPTKRKEQTVTSLPVFSEQSDCCA